MALFCLPIIIEKLGYRKVAQALGRVAVSSM